MFTSLDKAIVALLASAAFLLKEFAGIDIPLSDGVLNAVGVVVTTLAVYFVPNKAAE